MRKVLLIFIVIYAFCSCAEKKTPNIDLSGQWRFQIDAQDEGVDYEWYKKTLAESVQLPGSMATNNQGNEVSVTTKWTGGIVDSSWYHDEKYAKYRVSGNVKIPFWLQPDKYYVGAAWYQKTVEILEDWKHSYIELYLERCHWETQVWVDDQKVGLQNSLATPHIYDLTPYLSPGSHQISILVDNRIKDIDPGENSHSIADHTQSNWNGIVGRIELMARPKIHVDNVQVFPDVANGRVAVHGKIRNLTGKEDEGKISIATALNQAGANPPREQINEDVSISSFDQDFYYEFSLGDEVGVWDETYPNLYSLNIRLETKSGKHENEITFGMRNIDVDSTWFVINGRPIFLRGTLECAIFPKTGYPPTDPDEWKRIINVAKAHGLNHMRFHSWCPPEAAFNAADELGFYLQVECSSWANQSSGIGDGMPIDKYVMDESERIVKMYGNHPSFCFMAYGNEPRGRNHVNYLANFVDHWKTKDNRRLYSGAAGWPVLEENDYHNLPQPRIQGWGEELRSIINSEPPRTDYDWRDKIKNAEIPVVSHEIGQWCVYPNFNEIAKYDGVLKAKNFEIFQETLDDNGLGALADSFLLASGKLQTLCYKADIEAALRTPGFAGFQLLDLHDFPGQGTALVGVLDPFWEEKGYVTPEEYSRFCNTTVPLARMEKRIFYNDESFKAEIEVAHFGDEILPNVEPAWEITNKNNEVIFNGNFEPSDIPIGNCLSIGNLEIDLNEITSPSQLSLTINVKGFENDWDFWVYPTKNEAVEEIMMTSTLSKSAMTKLANGGSVIWSIPKSARNKTLNDGIGFSSIFWNTAWTKGQKPHSLGILCNPDHPALVDFPSEFHSNWQWWDAMSYSNGLILDGFSKDIEPVIRVIDDWFQNRNQALVIEVKVGRGKLLISSIDFFNNIENRPAGKQLLFSLKKYMSSKAFNPGVEITIEELKEKLS